MDPGRELDRVSRGAAILFSRRRALFSDLLDAPLAALWHRSCELVGVDPTWTADLALLDAFTMHDLDELRCDRASVDGTHVAYRAGTWGDLTPYRQTHGKHGPLPTSVGVEHIAPVLVDLDAAMAALVEVRRLWDGGASPVDALLRELWQASCRLYGPDPMAPAVARGDLAVLDELAPARPRDVWCDPVRPTE